MNLIDIYTQLKMGVNNEINVTYYSSYGYIENNIFILDDIIGFDYIIVSNSQEKIIIPFFGNNAIIEKISFVEEEGFVYYNPYVSKDLFFGEFVENEKLKKIKSLVLGNKRDLFENSYKSIQKYNKQIGCLSYDRLFYSEEEKNEFYAFFEILVDELKEYAIRNNLNPNLNIIGIGTTSVVYSIGDKIIKIGIPRELNNIPYCEYLLQPIINRTYYFDGHPIHIEVSQKTITCSNDNNSELGRIFDREIDELEDRLNAIGLKMYDLYRDNVGILISDNIINYDSINFEVGDENATSIQNNNDLKIKKKGEMVIIDLDDLEIVDNDKYLEYLNSIGYKDTNKTR